MNDFGASCLEISDYHTGNIRRLAGEGTPLLAGVVVDWEFLLKEGLLKEGICRYGAAVYCAIDQIYPCLEDPFPWPQLIWSHYSI
jgi:hypothetical protein